MKNANLIVLGIVALAVIVGGIFWFQGRKDVMEPMAEQKQQEQQETKLTDNQDTAILEPSKDYSVRPDFSKAQTFKSTLTLQKGVSVKYGNGWAGKKNTDQNEFVSGQLTKVVNGRSYMIRLAEIEYSLPDGKVDNVGLKIYDEAHIKGKPHAIVVTHLTSSTDTFDFSYISSCAAMSGNACPIQLGKTNLLVMLEQNVPGAQEPKGLDFSRRDDQQILAEFAEIASTLKY